MKRKALRVYQISHEGSPIDGLSGFFFAEIPLLDFTRTYEVETMLQEQHEAELTTLSLGLWERTIPACGF